MFRKIMAITPFLLLTIWAGCHQPTEQNSNDGNHKIITGTGTVLGEFQDETLWNQRLQEDSTLAEWSEKQICDAATGATLQSKTLGYLVSDRVVSSQDSTLTTSDAWGQYGIIIDSGTYSLTGSCEGYESITHVVNVLPDSIIYVNFILPRQVITKPIAKLNRN